MPEATLLQVLEAREKRVELQKQLIAAYNTSLICFTMNIAGPIKTSPLIERAFLEGESLLKERFCEDIIHSQSEISVTGCEAMFCVRADAQKVKSICAEIEDNHPLGRLFDMDVLTEKGEKLSRNTLRGCIVCGKSGRECAAGRLHSVEELQRVTSDIITSYFLKKDAEYIGSLAMESLLEEVYTTPKPGLVDRNNNGSHTDMNIALFEKSAHALKPYFSRFFEIGNKTKEMPYEKAFLELKTAGIEAEEEMFRATNGVNTHKGAIFSLGIICAAMGRLWDASRTDYDVKEILNLCSKMTKDSIEKDFENIDRSTAGGRLYLDYKIEGIRGEAKNGFGSVLSIALPIFKSALQNGFSRNDSGAITLVHLISRVEDTNIYNRGGKTGADFAKTKAKEILKDGDFPSILKLEQLDKEFIERNLSAGGCADLLAITYFLSKL